MLEGAFEKCVDKEDNRELRPEFEKRVIADFRPGSIVRTLHNLGYYGIRSRFGRTVSLSILTLSRA